jgi:hypothetical protein
MVPNHVTGYQGSTQQGEVHQPFRLEASRPCNLIRPVFKPPVGAPLKDSRQRHLRQTLWRPSDRNGSGQWTSRACSHGGLDNAMTTSGEGYRYLSSIYRYQPIFRNVKLPPNEENIFSFSFHRREVPNASATYALLFGHWRGFEHP